MSESPGLDRTKVRTDRELLVVFLSWLAHQGVRTLRWDTITEPDYPDVLDRAVWVADARTPEQMVDEFLAMAASGPSSGC
jgi:hypothetical protein